MVSFEPILVSFRHFSFFLQGFSVNHEEALRGMKGRTRTKTISLAWMHRRVWFEEILNEAAMRLLLLFTRSLDVVMLEDSQLHLQMSFFGANVVPHRVIFQ